MTDLPTPAVSPAEEIFARADALFQQEDWAGAKALLEPLVLAEDPPYSAHFLLARTLMSLGDPEGALAQAEAARIQNPGQPRAHMVAADILLRSQRFGDARAALERSIEAFPETAGLLAQHARACMSCGDLDDALTSIRRARSLLPDETSYALHEAAILAAAGDEQAARQLLEPLAADTEDLLRSMRPLIAWALEAQKHDEALRLAEDFCRLAPHDSQLRLLLAEQLLGADAAKEAVLLLGSMDMRGAPEIAFRVLTVKARAAMVLGQKEASRDAYEQALELQPNDDGTLEALYLVNQKLGRFESMRGYGRRLAALNARSLPNDLGSALEMLAPQGLDRQVRREVVGWAWSLADQSAWTKTDWLAAVEWGRRADKLTRRWWRDGQHRIDELDALIVRPETGVTDLLSPDERCLCATTHLGPMAGAVRYMETCGRPFRGFGVAGVDAVTGEGPGMRIAAGSPRGLQTMLTELRRGTLIGTAPDRPRNESAVTLVRDGVSYSLSTFVPRLARSQRAASLWWQAVWKDDRIHIEVERLPDLADGEDARSWQHRWCEAYLDRVIRTMRSDPRNLILGPGVWRHAVDGFLSRSALRLALARGGSGSTPGVN